MADRMYELTITGVTPLLMHWDNLQGAAQLAQWLAVPENKKTSKAGDDRTPPWVWKLHTYNDGKHIAIPEDVIRACLLKAGAKVPVADKGMLTFKTQTQTGISFPEPFLTFKNNGQQIKWADVEAIEGTYGEHCEAVHKLGFQLFAKRARVTPTSKHVRVRARFDTWGVHGMLLVTDPTITTEVLTEILYQGGAFVGLCDWRPGSPKSPGPFGRWTAKLKAA